MNHTRGFALLTILLALGVLVLIAGGYIAYTIITPEPTIDSFDACVAAGYPVMESYPRQCGVPNGPRFTEILTDAASCAAILCPTNTQCVSGACVPLDNLIINDNDPCMYVRCASGYRCVAGVGRCEKTDE